jgi:RNA polymerase primary sigma factor
MEVDEPLTVYLREVGNVQPMSKEEETALLGELQAGGERAEAAGTRLVEAHLRLVVSIAEQYREARVQILELVQRGNEGLLEAVKTIAPDSGEPFSDYAARCIEQAIAKYLA